MTTRINVQKFSGHVEVASNLTVDATTFHVDSMSNRIGVGTTLPSYKLDINGTLNSGALTATTGTFSDATNSTSKSTGALIVSAGGLGVEANIHTTNVFAASHIAIGTSDTTEALDVRGTAAISSNLEVGTAHLFVDTQSGRVGMGTTLPKYTIDVHGNANVGALSVTSLSFDPTDDSTSTTTGAFKITGGIGVTSNVHATNVYASNLYTTSYVIHRDDIDTKIGFPADDTFTVTTNNVERVRVDSTGNVGIGKTPGYKLDVNGTLNSGDLTATTGSFSTATHSTSKDTGALIVTTGGLGVEANIHSTNVFAASHIGIGTSDTTKALDVRGTANVGALTATSVTVPNEGGIVIDGKTLKAATGLIHWDWVNSRLGIGTSSPSAKLHVNDRAIIGNVYVGTWSRSGDYAAFQHTSLSDTVDGNYALLQHSDGTTFINTSSGKIMYFREDNGTKMVLKAGNVGIGTTDPGYKLDVNGTLNSGALTATTVTVPDDGDFVMNSKPLVPATGMYWDRVNSKLGIGTTTPLSLLTIRTNYYGGQSSGLCLDSTDGNVYNFRLYSFVQSGSNVGWNFRVNNGASSVDALTLGSTGNIGIGTTAPGYKLEVNGSLNSGALTATTGSFSGAVSLNGNNLIINSDVTPNNTAGISWHGSYGGYSITRTGGAWDSPNYQQLLIQWVTGIILDAGNGDYGRSYVGVNDRMAIGSSYYNSDTKPPDNGLLVEGNVGIGTTAPESKLHVEGDLTVSGKIYNYKYTEVDINAPDGVSGTWIADVSDEYWGDPRFNNTMTGKYRYNDAPGYVEYVIPDGMKSAYISQLQWDTGGYVDVHGVQSDGGLVFLRRINTRQTVENADEGNPHQHDGQTITFIGSGLETFSNIRLTNKVGRFHLDGLAFTSDANEGGEGTGMVHSAQISDLGIGIPTASGTGASGTWGINITGSAGSATSAGNANTVGGISANHLFNNMGGGHANRTDFNDVPDAGCYYVTGATNGPEESGQFYGFTLGLGTDYGPVVAGTNNVKYGYQIYWKRNAANPYIYTRGLEDGAWGAWSKASAGYADSAGSATTATTATTATNQSGGSVSATTGSFGSAIYYYEWIRNNGTYASGLYWENASNPGWKWHIYPENQSDMTMRTGAGNGGIKGTVEDGTARGYVHWTSSNEIGFLNSGREWSLRMDNSKNCEVYGFLKHQGLLFSYGTEIDQVKIIYKNIAVSTTWVDTGISGEDLPTGLYLVRIRNMNTHTVGGRLYEESVSGLLEWFSGYTNSNEYGYSTYTQCGHAPNASWVNLRTLRTPYPGRVKLQITSNYYQGTSYTYEFWFRRML